MPTQHEIGKIEWEIEIRKGAHMGDTDAQKKLKNQNRTIEKVWSQKSKLSL